MTRNILAVLIGVTLGVVIIASGEFAIQTLYPVGEIPTTASGESIRVLESVPTINAIALVINWALAALATSALATWIQGRTDFKPVAAAVGILQLLTYMNLLMLPGHPAWIWLTVTFMYMIIGYLTYRFLRRKNHVQANEH